jgi:alpha-beta hydrolase superfamily lysophospholipase
MSLWPVVATPQLVRENLIGAEASDAEVEELHAALQDESFLAYLDMMALALPRPGKTEAPVAVFAGAEDGLFSVREARRTAEAYGVEATVLEGLPHDVMLHRNWERAARGIARFLEAVT